MARAASKQDVTAMLLAWKTVPKCLVPESEPLLSGAGSRRLSVLIYWCLSNDWLGVRLPRCSKVSESTYLHSTQWLMMPPLHEVVDNVSWNRTVCLAVMALCKTYSHSVRRSQKYIHLVLWTSQSKACILNIYYNKCQQHCIFLDISDLEWGLS